MKCIDKAKLFTESMLHQARQECVLQSLFNHPNVVKLLEYTENESEIVLIMELVNDAGYLEHRLEDVSWRSLN